MAKSEQTNDIAAALAKAQAEMMPAIKDSANPFFKSKYADLTSVWSACREPLTKHGLSVTQTTSCESDGRIMLFTTLWHPSGQWIDSCLPVIPVKPDPQSLGAAITYARRFALCALVGICPEDDDGNMASGKAVITQQQPAAPAKISKEQVAALSKKLDLVPQCKDKMKEYLKGQGIMDLMDIPLTMYASLDKAADDAIKQLAEKAA